MREWLTINGTYREVLSRAGLDTFDGWMHVARGEARPDGRSESLTRFRVGGGDDAPVVYLKRFRPGRPSPHFVLRRSRQRREAESARMLRDLGVPTAEVVAAGERRVLACVSEAFVATREIPGAVSAIEFAETFHTLMRRERLALIDRLAWIVRRMHDARYIDHDLYLRNVLVSATPDGGHELFIIDSPRGGRRRFGLGRAKVRDLACLYRHARTFVSATDRLRFLNGYLGCDRLDAAGARLSRRIARYWRKG